MKERACFSSSTRSESPESLVRLSISSTCRVLSAFADSCDLTLYGVVCCCSCRGGVQVPTSSQENRDDCRRYGDHSNAPNPSAHPEQGGRERDRAVSLHFSLYANAASTPTLATAHTQHMYTPLDSHRTDLAWVRRWLLFANKTEDDILLQKELEKSVPE